MPKGYKVLLPFFFLACSTRTTSMPIMNLHPLLCYSQHPVESNHCCAILWDLREAPVSIPHVSSLDHFLPDAELTQHATSPPVTIFHVSCGFFPEEWSIEVRNPQGVTVLDVLKAIHSALQPQIHQHEWERLCKKHQDRVAAVFDARWRVSAEPEESRTHGVLRIDCLLHHTWFGGLSVSLEDENSCILSLRRPR
ncbi:ectomycorrhiza-regulated small secreted protein [Laccaria bicolor S238N-H82]|uniref:Ectomycorrhiza-regulated small secreted protein n=1 Tax=Laccaria bicolor (strain S238N-H82 / ATCC MYA-4686) TaxID=486041 RepID=B0DBL8_LACBS|nr:ectomycorrhiza-regulated small secreted protein [Laccaria bicolor S238N-H82]EDR08206.1 ectomycorrhiza-regulated small secreted protein [Laccaria bicolor S238N-H82]|eukprot:XP_001881276.1 ectomycorrhiza-regulated small secreted protein [Laccaria bicolor S238N-H82]